MRGQGAELGAGLGGGEEGGIGAESSDLEQVPTGGEGFSEGRVLADLKDFSRN